MTSRAEPKKIALYVGLGVGAIILLVVLVTVGGRSGSAGETTDSPVASSAEPAAPPVPVHYAELGGMTMGEWVAKQAADNAQIKERQQRFGQFSRQTASEAKRPKSGD